MKQRDRKVHTVLISEYMIEQNRLLHESAIGYGGNGFRNAPEVDDFARSLRARSILDYGCGTGSLAKMLKELGWDPKKIPQYDPAIPGKDREPPQSDVVVCLDVLEHVEPDCITDVVRHIFTLTRKGCYLVIATRPAAKTLPDGRNTHAIIMEGHKWYSLIKPLADDAGMLFTRSIYNWSKNGEPHDAQFWLTGKWVHAKKEALKEAQKETERTESVFLQG